MGSSTTGFDTTRCVLDADGDLHLGGDVYNSDGNNIKAQLDVLDTTVAAELAFIDGVTAGTVTASKALVVDASKDIATVHDFTLNGNLTWTGATTANIITVPTNLADALSLVDSAGDILVLDTTTGTQVLTITPPTTITGAITASAGVKSTAQTVTPAADSGAGSTINAGVTAVDVAAVTNDADDWIVLPAVANVPVGHEIVIACNAGTAFEIRTPAASNEKINTVDADGGAAELTCVDTEVVRLTKVSDTDGWIAISYTALGATNGALTPS